MADTPLTEGPEPEQFEWFSYSATEFPTVRTVVTAYRSKGWATPISGDATARFLYES